MYRSVLLPAYKLECFLDSQNKQEAICTVLPLCGFVRCFSSPPVKAHSKLITM
jgi:hypothetical protein